MKVAILTQPLGHNYGGLLQAYALQIYLKRLGFDVLTIDRREPRESQIKLYKRSFSNFLKLALGKIKCLPTDKRHSIILKNLHEFRDSYLSLSPTIHTDDEMLKYFKRNHYDMVVVGSDQVWRPKYSPSLLNYFLNFIDDKEKTKCISYAASFGVDFWEFDCYQTLLCKDLVKRFNAVSVRESSAVELCFEHLGIVAEKVVDPTMLLDSSDYENLIDESVAESFEGKVLNYILDAKEDKQNVASKVSMILNQECFFIKPQKELKNIKAKDIFNFQYPKVEYWMTAFKTSSFVVTDSFHGCVFSILFNKPFIAVGNASRGLARFESLLSMFGLESRLVVSALDITEAKINDPINWEKVNLLKKEYSDKGKVFLHNAIEGLD